MSSRIRRQQALEKRQRAKIYSNGFAGGILVYTTFDRKVKMEIPVKAS
jgi:hypothetical protein